MSVRNNAYVRLHPTDLLHVLAVDEYLADAVQDVFFTSFPESCKDFPNSLPAQALQRCALSLYFLPVDADVEKPSRLAELFKSVQLSLPVLATLATSNFACSRPGLEVSDEENEENDKVKITKRKRTQRQSKQGKVKRDLVSTVDRTPFQKLGLNVPSSPEEAEEVARTLLAEQKQILAVTVPFNCPAIKDLSFQQVLLEYIRKPNISLALRRQYIPDDLPEVRTTADICEESKASDLETNGLHDDAPSSAFPLVQPMKAALYFDSAEGFGDWRIFISTQGQKDLRVNAKNRPIFDIIVKKIMYVSVVH